MRPIGRRRACRRRRSFRAGRSCSRRRELAALAARAGSPSVSRAAGAPRVAVIVVTGHRAARPGETLGPGQIYESNGDHARRGARRGGSGRRAARGGGGRRGRPSARARDGARGRRRRHVRRRLGRPARSRAPRRRRGSASRRCSGASPCARASRSHSASASGRSSSGCREIPVSVARRRLLFVVPRCSHSRATPTRRPRFRPRSAPRPRCSRDPSATTSSAHDSAGPRREPSSTRSSGQESHMIVRPPARTRSCTCRAAEGVLPDGGSGAVPGIDALAPAGAIVTDRERASRRPSRSGRPRALRAVRPRRPRRGRARVASTG